MVAIFIVTDKGEAYCMSSTIEDATACLESVKAGAKAKYIHDRERRLQYITRAFDVIEGGQGNGRISDPKAKAD
jgi:hypothetical protein